MPILKHDGTGSSQKRSWLLPIVHRISFWTTTLWSLHSLRATLPASLWHERQNSLPIWSTRSPWQYSGLLLSAFTFFLHYTFDSPPWDAVSHATIRVIPFLTQSSSQGCLPLQCQHTPSSKSTTQSSQPMTNICKIKMKNKTNHLASA